MLKKRFGSAGARGVLAVFSVCVAGGVSWGGSLPLPTTATDFDAPGTQPNTLFSPIAPASDCFTCHAGTDDPMTTVKPYRWRGSAHAHAARDPIFLAAVDIANADAPGSGTSCYRCHAPRAFLEGRGAADGSQLTFQDRDEGVGCNVCHRAVDPFFTPENPVEDQAILAALGNPPVSFGNAQLVIDPSDFRRGPFDDVDPPHLWLHSPHHQTSDMCAACHDVSNPALSRIGGSTPQSGDVYRINAVNTPHPDHVSYEMFPEQRTYSEWLNSAFAQPGGLPASDPSDPYDLDGRFGGNATSISDCQDCHMPDQTGQGCIDAFNPPTRTDLPDHGFVGANTLLPDLILATAGKEIDAYTQSVLQRHKAETVVMLEKATDMYLTEDGCDLNVRVVNQCGHKLLTGYPEGRRIWINVKFFDGQGGLVAERGAYDFQTAELTESDTKVYETKMGLDSYMAGETGLPEGPTFHLVLNNTILKDNRIPPRGFTNAAFEEVQAQHVGYSYPDGQHWDDTLYGVPAGAASAEVTVYYQTASKEYIEFLRDNAPPGATAGDTLYNAWVAVGKSTPVVMDQSTIALSAGPEGDADGNRVVDVNDITFVVSRLGGAGPEGDADGNGVVDVNDITFVVSRLGDGC